MSNILDIFRNSLTIKPGDIVRLESRHMPSRRPIFTTVCSSVAFLGLDSPFTVFVEHYSDGPWRYGTARFYSASGGQVDLSSDVFETVRIRQDESGIPVVQIPGSGDNRHDMAYRRSLYQTMRVNLETLSVVDK